MYNIVYIWYSSDMCDEFYEVENNFFDEQLFIFEEFKMDFYWVLFDLSWCQVLEEKYGEQFFVIVEMSLKIFYFSVIEDLQEENCLLSSYNKFKVIVEIEFEGKMYNLFFIQFLEEYIQCEKRVVVVKVKWDWLVGQ